MRMKRCRPNEWLWCQLSEYKGKKYNKVRVGLLLYILEIAKLRKIQKRERKVKKRKARSDAKRKI